MAPRILPELVALRIYRAIKQRDEAMAVVQAAERVLVKLVGDAGVDAASESVVLVDGALPFGSVVDARTGEPMPDGAV